MKRCPQCNRIESEETLTFCRVDGTPLVREYVAVGKNVGTLEFGSAPVTDDTDTRILPTGDALGRPAAPTTVLDTKGAPGGAREFSRSKSGLVIAAALIAVAVAASAYLYLLREKNATAKNSIAVLPFVNASSDPDVEYLSDGVTESLINSLSQLPHMRVMARTTMFTFKGKEVNPLQVGRQLGVSTVLTGRVVQRGDSLIVQADLVNVEDGSQLWGERFNRRMNDIVALQGEIAREVSGKLRAKLSGADERKLAKKQTENAEAYRLYLQGRFHWNKRTGEGVTKSVEYFRRAVEQDPTYALAYAGLADAYSVIPSFADGSPDEFFPKARAAAERAIELDESLAEAHTALARVLFAYEWKFAESDREYRRAIELNPNYPTAHHWYGNANLLRTGRFEEAVAEGRRAQELDPLSLVINTDLGENYLHARRYDEAIEQLRKTVAMDDRFYYAHRWLGVAYLLKGFHREAIAEYERARQLNDNQQLVSLLGHAYALSGNRAEALKSLARLGEISERVYVPPYHFARIYVGLGDKEQAFEWLERGYRERNQEMTRLKVDPFLDPLRSDPRFADLMRRVGLPQ